MYTACYDHVFIGAKRQSDTQMGRWEGRNEGLYWEKTRARKEREGAWDDMQSAGKGNKDKEHNLGRHDTNVVSWPGKSKETEA